MYILHIPSWFPNDKMPFQGNFIEKHIDAIAISEKCVTIRVVRNAEVKKNKDNNIYKLLSINENNILIEYSIKNRVSFFGKILMKVCEWYYYRKGMKLINKKFGKPKLIHLHVALPLGLFAVKWSKKWNIPLVLSEHWSIYQKQNRSLLSFFQLRNLKKIYRTISGITTVSNDLLIHIKEMFSLNKSAVIYNVVDTELFIPNNKENFPKIILHVSTLDERAKNFLGILEAIKLLSKKRQDFILEVIHEFKNSEAEDYVKNQELNSIVHFLGSMPEKQVAKKMGTSDFLILFSNYENLPCVLLEAMSCGKPVITTPVGGIPEIVNEKRGIFVESKNVYQLAEKMDFMLQNHDTFESNLSRNYAETYFSKEAIRLQFQKFYEEILDIFLNKPFTSSEIFQK